MTRRLRIVFFGTPEFAVPTLERLIAGSHEIVAVVSQPDRRRGRGRKLSPSPVAACAEAAGVTVLRPERVGAAEAVEALAERRPDLGVVAAFGQFIPKRVRELPRCGYLINAHASLLPRHRGAAPIAHALLAGDRETGISVMRIEKEMDAGPVALVRRVGIDPDENAGHLGERLAALAADAIAEAVEQIAAGTIRWTPQDPEAVTFAPKIDAESALLDFAEPATALVRRVRALAPQPGAFTWWRGERLRVLAARHDRGDTDRPPGTLRVDAQRVCIATSEGWLVPTLLQRAGAKAVPIDAFQRGRGLADGDVLGVAPDAQSLGTSIPRG